MIASGKSSCYFTLIACRKKTMARKRRARDKHVSKMEQVLRAIENNHLLSADLQSAQEMMEYILGGGCDDEALLCDFGVPSLTQIPCPQCMLP
jgi:hypothetical protein